MLKSKEEQCNLDLSIRMHTEIQHMYLNEMLMDVVLVVHGIKIPAHRIVLAATSPFFQAMLTSGMEECRQDEIILDSLEAEAVQAIVTYMYSGTLSITGENVMGLLQASNMLEMMDVVNQCCCILISELNPYNCLDIMMGAETFRSRPECNRLYSASVDYVNNYFIRVKSTSSFLNMTVTSLVELLTHDDLCSITEGNVYDAALSWLHHDLLERRCHAPAVLACIRFSLIDSHDMTNIVTSTSLIGRDGNATTLQTLILNMTCTDTIQRPRRRGIPTLFAIGGCDGKQASRSMEWYDAMGDNWCSVADMTEKRSYFGTAVLDGYIYSIGGHNDLEHLASMERYTVCTNTWTFMEPMSDVRSYLGVVSCHGYLYAIGGYDGDSHTDLVERFDPILNVWETMCKLNVPRSGLGATIVEGSIYVIGGFDGTQHLSSVERYNPLSNTWTMLPSMKEIRNGPGVAVLDNKIVVFGGEFKHGKRVSSSESFCTKSEVWSTSVPMKDCTSGHSIVSVNDTFLYAIGGSNQENKYLSTLHRYDVLSKSWKTFCPMNEMRCGLSVILVDAIPLWGKERSAMTTSPRGSTLPQSPINHSTAA